MVQLDFFQTVAQTEAQYHAAPHWITTRSGKRVQAVYNPRVRCGWKCQTATGPACECSCEGRNHGGRA